MSRVKYTIKEEEIDALEMKFIRDQGGLDLDEEHIEQHSGAPDVSVTAASLAKHFTATSAAIQMLAMQYGENIQNLGFIVNPGIHAIYGKGKEDFLYPLTALHGSFSFSLPATADGEIAPIKPFFSILRACCSGTLLDSNELKNFSDIITATLQDASQEMREEHPPFQPATMGDIFVIAHTAILHGGNINSINLSHRDSEIPMVGEVKLADYRRQISPNATISEPTERFEVDVYTNPEQLMLRFIDALKNPEQFSSLDERIVSAETAEYFGKDPAAILVPRQISAQETSLDDSKLVEFYRGETSTEFATRLDKMRGKSRYKG